MFDASRIWVTFSELLEKIHDYVWEGDEDE